MSVISLALAFIGGTAGLPHVLMRFFTVPDARQARNSIGYAVTFIGYFMGLTVIIGFAGGTIQRIAANRLLLKNAAAIGFYWGGHRKRDPARVRACLEELLRWCAQGRIRPHASDVLPLARARDALELLLSRRSTGKVVLRMD